MTGNNDYHNLRRNVNALSSNVTKMIGSQSASNLLGRSKDIKIPTLKEPDNFRLPYVNTEERGDIDSSRNKILSTQASTGKNL